MVTILINPGSGPVADADEPTAWANMGSLVEDLVHMGVEVSGVTRARDRDHEGRYGFTLITRHLDPDGGGTYVVGPVFDIDMPGSNAIHDEPPLFPARLYVDGSSWFRPAAIRVIYGNYCDSRDGKDDLDG